MAGQRAEHAACGPPRRRRRGTCAVSRHAPDRRLGHVVHRDPQAGSAHEVPAHGAPPDAEANEPDLLDLAHGRPDPRVPPARARRTPLSALPLAFSRSSLTISTIRGTL